MPLRRRRSADSIGRTTVVWLELIRCPSKASFHTARPRTNPSAPLPPQPVLRWTARNLGSARLGMMQTRLGRCGLDHCLAVGRNAVFPDTPAPRKSKRANHNLCDKCLADKTKQEREKPAVLAARARVRDVAYALGLVGVASFFGRGIPSKQDGGIVRLSIRWAWIDLAASSR